MKLYNIATDGKDDLPACIKLLKAVTRSIVAMRADGSNRNKILDLFIVDIIEVLQTSSIQPFTDKMKQFHNNIDSRRFEGSIKSFNTLTVLEDVYAYANRVYTEMFNVCTWQDAILSKPKSSFNSAAGNVFWKNRCWNCKQKGCNQYKCPKPADKARTEKMSWVEEKKIIRVQRPIQLIIVITGGREQHLTSGVHQQVMNGISTSFTANLIPGMERTPGFKMIP